MLARWKGFEAEAALDIELVACLPCHGVGAGNLIFEDLGVYLWPRGDFVL